MSDAKRVLIHAPTRAALQRARSNAKNLAAALPDIEIEIVVNAEGAAALVDTPDTVTAGMVRLCGNSLRAQGLEAPEGIRVVQAAVAHIVECQAEGWAYIRA